MPGDVVGLVAAVQEAVADGARRSVHWVSGSGPGRNRIRLNRKNPAHLAGIMVQSRPRVWKRLRHVGHSSTSIPDPKKRRGDQDDWGYALDQDWGGMIPWVCAGPRLQVCSFFY